MFGLDLTSIRRFRISASLTQSKVADLSGVAQSKLSKIERGVANPEIATLNAICAALDAELIIVPRRIGGDVMNMVDRHLNRHVPTVRPVMSVRDEVFIPDGED
jgi:transcriptional regulator with XRE-family HTH domain